MYQHRQYNSIDRLAPNTALTHPDFHHQMTPQATPKNLQSDVAFATPRNKKQAEERRARNVRRALANEPLWAGNPEDPTSASEAESDDGHHSQQSYQSDGSHPSQ